VENAVRVTALGANHIVVQLKKQKWCDRIKRLLPAAQYCCFVPFYVDLYVRWRPKLNSQLVDCDGMSVCQLTLFPSLRDPKIAVAEHTGAQHIDLALGVRNAGLKNSDVFSIAIALAVELDMGSRDRGCINCNGCAPKMGGGETENAITRADVEEKHGRTEVVNEIVEVSGLFRIR